MHAGNRLGKQQQQGGSVVVVGVVLPQPEDGSSNLLDGVGHLPVVVALEQNLTSEEDHRQAGRQEQGGE